MTLDIPMRFDSAPLLWTVEGVYTPDECAAFIELIERSSPTLATNNPMFRDQDRVIRDDPAMGTDLFKRLRPHLPERIGPLTLDVLDHQFHMYRYKLGQRFHPHMDHWYRHDEYRITLLTVLIYFNGDFEGGETRFMEQIERVVVPQPGLAAIFQHKIRHEGCPVIRGTKYAMRTDVTYRSPEPIGKTG